jgi:aerobic-type carbon monoxide dehydrogenase small subunit (CoxS/CutS family)
LFCGIGACLDCLVTVDGVGGVRACVAPAVPGAEIRTDGGAADV